MKKLMAVVALGSTLLVSTVVQAETDIGEVYGNSTWIAYISSTSGIFIRKGVTDFALNCGTGFVSKGDHVDGPDGTAYYNKSQTLTAIQVRLVRGDYKDKGCS